MVPSQSKALFDRRAGADIEPVFYTVRRESQVQRVMRRLGVIDARAVARSQLRVDGGDGSPRDVRAVWLSPGAHLNCDEMRGLLEALPELEWVYSQVTATDHLDLDAFKRRGVKVSNSGNLSSRRVAEMALACMLAHAKRLPQHFELQKRRVWQSLGCDDVAGQTVGIIGTGRIGGELARLCRGVGMYVLGVSRDPERFGKDPDPYDRVARLDRDLETVLAQVDHVVLVLPLNPETYKLIGPTELSQMRRHSSLINVARGAVVDEDALCDALTRGVIGGAYVEQTTSLPPGRGSRVYRCPNLVLTHYSSAGNARALEEAWERFLLGLRRLIETGEPPDRVA